MAAVDDIQVLLDEHPQKVQTMRGSPYVKPFETEMRSWEEKLLSMQDILDAWIKVSYHLSCVHSYQLFYIRKKIKSKARRSLLL